jgi:hypothetical protein
VAQLAVILRQTAFFAPVMEIRVHSQREKFVFLALIKPGNKLNHYPDMAVFKVQKFR